MSSLCQANIMPEGDAGGFWTNSPRYPFGSKVEMFKLEKLHLEYLWKKEHTVWGNSSYKGLK